MIRISLYGIAVAMLLSSILPARAYVEPPVLADAVAAGELPPVDERLPDPPVVVNMDRPGQSVGEYGGTLTTLMGRAKDIRLMTVYGYARLVAYDENFNLVPDILKDIEIDEGRIFTMHLRPGHKWSDGHPFTSEDFRYYWEDVANNEEISPFGVTSQLMVNGEAPRVEFLDALTVRYSWSQPNPYFLPALAGASPLYIYRPAHYLKQFHARYVEPEALQKLVEEKGSQNWAGMHNRRDHQYNYDNVDLPVLQPWINTTEPPSERFVFVRNPYYHRVDPEGRQLPYIDEVIISVVDGSLIPAKAGFGETDLQGRYVSFEDYTFLKEGEATKNYKVSLWTPTKGSQLALHPNLNAADPMWRDLMRDVRLRRALSLAIDRHEINQAIYFGLGIVGNNTILEESPLYRPEYRNRWAEFDLDKANALLDEMGLDQRDSEGFRLLPNGEQMTIVVETAGESTEETDVLELIRDSWAKAGIALFTKPSQREVFRNRVFSGEAIMSVWSGLTNGVPTADMPPSELAPTIQHQLQWPKWGQYVETQGGAGEPADDPVVKELSALLTEWERSFDVERKREIWLRMLEIHAEQQYTIGTVTGIFQPVIVTNHLKNVPEKGIWNWDPGSYFGIYRPDTFWFDDERRAKAN